MRAALFGLTILLIGCGGEAQKEDQKGEVKPEAEPILITQAKQLILDNARDANATEFRGMRVVTSPFGGGSAEVVCGEVNSANAMGGKTGFVGFALDVEQGIPGGLATADEDPEVYKRACG